MRILVGTESRTVWIACVPRPYTFVSPASPGGYALLLIVGDDAIDDDERARLAEQFVRTGCRYAVCFGPTSSGWDDAIDMVSAMDRAEQRAGPFVMTTWFDRDAIATAVDFFAECTHFDDWVAREFVVLVLGGDDALARDVERAVLDRFA